VKKNTKVVYTIIFGGYDTLKTPDIVSPSFDYVCFTDDPELKSEIWQIRIVQKPKRLNYKRFTAEFVTNPFSHLREYKLSVWIGAQISIHCDIEDFVAAVLPENKSLAIMNHPIRNCVYEEAEKVIEFNKDYVHVVQKQMLKYRKLGLPEHGGLVSGGIIVRRHNNKKVRQHCRLWYREIKNHSQRDQLSFNFILWKYKLIEPAYFSPQYREKDFIVHPHNYIQAFS
jgi:hypothetical protein